MDFSFTPEQDDLRREARSFLESNPSPSMEQLAELGWVGILQGSDFTFLDAAVLFDPATVSQIDLTLSDEARQALLDDPST